MIDNVKFTYAGALKCTASTTRYSEGQHFYIIEAEEISGTFENLEFPVLPEGLGWNTSKLYTSGLITIESVEINSIEGNKFNVGVLENVTKGIYNISFENVDSNISLQVYNSKGQIVVDRVVNNVNGVETIDITDSAKGIYMLYRKPENGKLETFQLIKE